MRRRKRWGKLPLQPHASVDDLRKTPCIYILAGTNGGGKSSIAGATIPQWLGYYNPDEAARRLRIASAGMTEEEASSAAWEAGVNALERAIKDRASFALETTLGGQTITSLLEKAFLQGVEVRVWYVGLSSPELHIVRVRARVARGGHDVPESWIRSRYHSSPKNLIQLLPRLTELRVYDNSEDADPNTGATPVPKPILHIREGAIIEVCDPPQVPQWAQPIVAAAEKAFLRSPGPRT